MKHPAFRKVVRWLFPVLLFVIINIVFLNAMHEKMISFRCQALICCCLAA